MSEAKQKRAELIASLAADLEPVADPGRTGRRTFVWLGMALVVSIALMLVRAPFRPGFVEQLIAHPQFALESLFGIAAIIATALAAFRTAVPAPKRPVTEFVIPLGLMCAWLGFYLYGLHNPAIPPSMIGKRAHCDLEVLIIGVPALALGLIGLRRLYPLRGAYSGLLIGLAAGAIPALLMQFGCMYLPPHILVHHVLPGFALSLLGAALGALLLRPR